MPGFDIRQDKPYRRGLILGLTMAEIMILLIFVLLMALASALSSRDKEIQAFEPVVSLQMVDKIRASYPASRTKDDYYKELVRAINADKAWGQNRPKGIDDDLLEDAALGRKVREAANKSSALSADDFLESALKEDVKRKKTDTPPFFNLSEEGGYYFDTGKATLRPEVKLKLEREVIPRLRRMVAEYDVDVVEVVGHTDEVPMTGASNLDQFLIPASENTVPVSKLGSTDNAGLAIARAVSVVSLLRASPELKGLTILPLSGAQMILPGDRLADGSATQSDQSRRRIELRLRRKSRQVDGT